MTCIIKTISVLCKLGQLKLLLRVLWLDSVFRNKTSSVMGGFCCQRWFLSGPLLITIDVLLNIWRVWYFQLWGNSLNSSPVQRVRGKLTKKCMNNSVNTMVCTQVCTQVKIDGTGAHCGCSLMVVLPLGEAQSGANNNTWENQGCTTECLSRVLIQWEVVMEISPGRFAHNSPRCLTHTCTEIELTISFMIPEQSCRTL